MADRYNRYNTRPRSPTYNPARASLPINLSGFGHPAAHEHHTSTLHVIPTSRREQHVPTGHSRSSSTANSSAGTVTTTYKITAEPPPRNSSRSESRRRSSTIETNNRPTVVTTVRHKPVVHSARPPSPMKNPYRSSQEDYYAVPAVSSHNTSRSHHHRHSLQPDDVDMGRIATEGNRLRIGSGRQEAAYSSSRPRSQYPTPVARHTDTSNGEYPDDGFGYTNPGSLASYDLSHPPQPRRRERSDSFDGGRNSRPTSISGYTDLVPRAADPRERGPPPTTRGFDRIPRGQTWEQPATVRMPVVPPPPQMEPVQRPARMELPFKEQPVRRSGSQRPMSMYHERDREGGRRGSRDDIYEVRDPEPRRRRDSSSHRRPEPRFDNPVESRGFGIRAEAPPPQPPRPERVERSDRPERVERVDRIERIERDDRPERSDRHERSDRLDRVDRPERSDRDRLERNDRSDRPDRGDRGDRGERSNDDRDHKSGRDILTTGLGLAGAALGLKSIKNARDESREDREKEEREEREERRRRDHDDDERRRRRDSRDGREAADKPKERRHRDEDRDRVSPPPRDIPQAPREEHVSSRDIPPSIPPKVLPTQGERDMRERHSDPVALNLSGRDPKERPASRNERSSSISERDGESDRRERRRRSERSPTREDSRSDSASEPIAGLPHRESRSTKESAPTAAFNPKDTMDLKALKDALNSKDNAAPREVSPPVPKAARASFTKTSSEVADIRSDINDDRRSRDDHHSTDNVQPRVVSPPRSKVEDKPVKGILRAPREKFPEDPSPIREGVAPLKDAKKDGVPPEARWTKINRKLVNPEALELGKERYEARDDFVIVLRVLSRDEVQGYAEVTQKLRAAREDAERDERRRARRERHERHKRERTSGERSERSERRRARREEKPRESESDTTEDDEPERDAPKMLEPAPPRRRLASNNFEDAMMSGGLSGPPPVENPNVPGQYLNYTRNPPPPSSLVASTGSSSRRDR